MNVLAAPRGTGMFSLQRPAAPHRHFPEAIISNNQTRCEHCTASSRMTKILHQIYIAGGKILCTPGHRQYVLTKGAHIGSCYRDRGVDGEGVSGV
jgi:hypothetical protein